MGIYHYRSYIAVAQEGLDCADIVVGLQKMRGKKVANGMGRYALGELDPPDGLIKRKLDVRLMKMKPP